MFVEGDVQRVSPKTKNELSEKVVKYVHIFNALNEGYIIYKICHNLHQHDGEDFVKGDADFCVNDTQFL